MKAIFGWCKQRDGQDICKALEHTTDRPVTDAQMRRHSRELGWYHEQALVPMGESFYIWRK
ncbi:MAG TPA: hypothetical protein DCW34_05420 [Erysipelotrichaceae bacterium]|nr:hypothetical protein [Erysipelotrichaceae bacterium]